MYTRKESRNTDVEQMIHGPPASLNKSLHNCRPPHAANPISVKVNSTRTSITILTVKPPFFIWRNVQKWNPSENRAVRGRVRNKKPSLYRGTRKHRNCIGNPLLNPLYCSFNLSVETFTVTNAAMEYEVEFSSSNVGARRCSRSTSEPFIHKSSYCTSRRSLYIGHLWKLHVAATFRIQFKINEYTGSSVFVLITVCNISLKEAHVFLISSFKTVHKP